MEDGYGRGKRGRVEERKCSESEQRPVLWVVQGHTFRYGDIVNVKNISEELPYIAFICDKRDKILNSEDEIKLQWLYRTEDIDSVCIERAERRLRYRIISSREVFWSFHQDTCPVASIMGLQRVFVTTREPEDIERDVPNDAFVCRHVYDPALGRILKLRAVQTSEDMHKHIQVAFRAHAYPFAITAPKPKKDATEELKRRQRYPEVKLQRARQTRCAEDPKARAEARLIELAMQASLEDQTEVEPDDMPSENKSSSGFSVLSRNSAGSASNSHDGDDENVKLQAVQLHQARSKSSASSHARPDESQAPHRIARDAAAARIGRHESEDSGMGGGVSEQGLAVKASEETYEAHAKEASESREGCDEPFASNLEELKMYKRQHGHACPASREGALGIWLRSMRRCYSQGTLAASKIEELKAVGVEFDGVRAQDIRAQCMQGIPSAEDQEGCGGSGSTSRADAWDDDSSCRRAEPDVGAERVSTACKRRPLGERKFCKKPRIITLIGPDVEAALPQSLPSTGREIGVCLERNNKRSGPREDVTGQASTENGALNGEERRILVAEGGRDSESVNRSSEETVAEAGTQRAIDDSPDVVEPDLEMGENAPEIAVVDMAAHIATHEHRLSQAEAKKAGKVGGEEGKGASDAASSQMKVKEELRRGGQVKQVDELKGSHNDWTHGTVVQGWREVSQALESIAVTECGGASLKVLTCRDHSDSVVYKFGCGFFYSHKCQWCCRVLIPKEGDQKNVTNVEQLKRPKYHCNHKAIIQIGSRPHADHLARNVGPCKIFTAAATLDKSGSMLRMKKSQILHWLLQKKVQHNDANDLADIVHRTKKWCQRCQRQSSGRNTDGQQKYPEGGSILGVRAKAELEEAACAGGERRPGDGMSCDLASSGRLGTMRKRRKLQKYHEIDGLGPERGVERGGEEGDGVSHRTSSDDGRTWTDRQLSSGGVEKDAGRDLRPCRETVTRPQAATEQCEMGVNDGDISVDSELRLEEVVRGALDGEAGGGREAADGLQSGRDSSPGYFCVDSTVLSWRDRCIGAYGARAPAVLANQPQVGTRLADELLRTMAIPAVLECEDRVKTLQSAEMCEASAAATGGLGPPQDSQNRGREEASRHGEVLLKEERGPLGLHGSERRPNGLLSALSLQELKLEPYTDMARYTGLGRVWLHEDSVLLVAQKLGAFLQPEDRFVDMACGANRLGPALHQLYGIGWRAYDVVAPPHNLSNFERKSFFEVSKLEVSGQLVVGLLPPAGHALSHLSADSFVQHALTLEPRLLVLLLPDALCFHPPPPDYRPVHHDDQISRSLSFVLPGTGLDKRPWNQVLACEPHLLILQRQSIDNGVAATDDGLAAYLPRPSTPEPSSEALDARNHRLDDRETCDGVPTGTDSEAGHACGKAEGDDACTANAKAEDGELRGPRDSRSGSGSGANATGHSMTANVRAAGWRGLPGGRIVESHSEPSGRVAEAAGACLAAVAAAGETSEETLDSEKGRGKECGSGGRGVKIGVCNWGGEAPSEGGPSCLAPPSITFLHTYSFSRSPSRSPSP